MLALLKRKTGICLALLACCMNVGSNLNAQQQNFHHDFAPSEDRTTSLERPFRDDICLNGSWKFFPERNVRNLSKDQLRDPALPKSFSWENMAVKIPSPWNINSFAQGGGDFVTYPSYPKDWDTVRAGWLMRKFSYKKEWKGKRLVLHFDAVAGYTQIIVNGKKVGQNYDVFLPFEVDITDEVKQDGENELMLWVADADLLNEPGKYGKRLYVGGSFWGQHINGIWQDAYLLVKPEVYVANAFVKAQVDKDEVQVEYTLINTTNAKKSIDIGGSVSQWINLAGKSTVEAPEVKWTLDNKEALSFPSQKITLAAGEKKIVTLAVPVKGRLKTWSAETPNLYGLVTTLSNGKTTVDKQYERFGWRQFKIEGDKLYLNGQRVVMKGDSWHFMGIPQMTRRYAWAWYTMLKDAHANAVRLHAQPYPSFYLDMADEMGIYILDETGLWASDGGPKEDGEEYWTNAADHLKRFILRDRNHASVFGWSVCNENIPVAVFVHHSPDSLVNRQLQEINRWVAITKELDPTRNWISGDGETDRPTDLPTIIGHYGDENSYRNWSSKGKLWGIGESGMAYYGTPRQTAQYNGNRSYVSQQGRMEGVAIEAVRLLNGQKKFDASYYSIFNIVWYGLKPLEFGLKDTTRAPQTTDGIFFDAFVEGKPGVQPERLGPYTSTLNPGYDPSLPLYRTWPLFDAIQASYATNEQVTGYEKIEDKAGTNNTRKPAYSKIILLSSDPETKMAALCKDLGINTTDKVAATDHALVLVDGKFPPSDKTSIALCNTVTAKSGDVFIIGANEKTATAIAPYLPYAVKVVDRKATSFIKEADDAVLNGFGNAELYLSEMATQPVSSYCLDGEFVNKSKVLISACNADWKAWNGRAEYSKTISLVKSERENKPTGNVMVVYPVNQGNIYFTTLDPQAIYKTSERVLYGLLANIGVTFNAQSGRDLSAIDNDGQLQHALFVDSVANGKSTSRTLSASSSGVLDASDIQQSKDGASYISFWVYSPRSLVNLLAEPDMPVLNMDITTKSPWQVFLNGKGVDAASIENKKDGKIIHSLPLERGWNHFLVQNVQRNNLGVQVKFISTQKEFIDKMRSKVSQ